jgi:V8-like Glu-specific endopeptidase
MKSAPVALAITAALGPGVPHPPPGVADHAIVIRRSAILRYWTPERMRHAVGIPGTTRHDAPAGDPLAGPPGAPEPAAPPGGRWSARGSAGTTTGKVFFTINGADYVCSAGTVTSANHDLVVTAGHCAQDASGAWAQNWIYVPGYDRGDRPYGTFAARRFFVPEQWSTTHDENYDVAMVALAPAGERHVADVTGTQNIAFDTPRGQPVYAFGYPIGGRYDGGELVYCDGAPNPDMRRITQGQGLACDMNEGASGGPWLSRFDAGSGIGVVTSVNSFKYADDQATMYGPYFGPAVRRVYEEAQQA